MKQSEKSRILIIAGPNNAGKTTFAEEFLPNEADCPIFVNADLIAVGLRNFEEIYKPIVNEWALYDNSFATPILIEEGENP
jgi:predicted ABC-type ATPase